MSAMQRRTRANRVRFGSEARRQCGLTLVAAFAITMAGCAVSPPPAPPLGTDEIRALAEHLTVETDALQALRASGSGSAKVAGRKVFFSFAIVYDEPDWLRADLRPEVGSLSSTLTALMLWSDQCARTYFPARSIEVRGCVSRADGSLTGFDIASAALGAIDRRALEELKDVTVVTEGDVLHLEGRYHAVNVAAEFVEEPPRLRSLTIRDGENTLTLKYRGHGWKPFRWFPKTVSATLVRGGREAMTFDLEYSSAKLTGHVDRNEFGFEVPAGVRIMSWEDLGLWRSQ